MGNTDAANKNVRFTAVFFSNEDDLKACAMEARLRGINVYDVFSPFPVHGIDAAVGLEPSRLTWIGFIAGVFGLSFALVLQVWTSAYDWALNVGGKPFNSFPLFIPVAFELTVLFAGLISIGVLFMRNRLWIFSKKKIFDGVTDDRFVLVLQQMDASLDTKKARLLFEKYNAVEITEGDEFV
ncbi:MAG: DUF3341 domain-containing protein [Acidobacteriota bacterium]|nr:DUF3341 domain-containing protein [Acidobacteriota bacterium]